jgi:hypothetical protein
MPVTITSELLIYPILPCQGFTSLEVATCSHALESNGLLEYWSIAKYQIPNTKFQYSMTKTGLEF